jgi:hypothetical protein
MLASSLEDRLGDFAEINAEGFLQPLTNVVGAALNSGLFTTAEVLKPLNFSFKISAVIVPISNADKTFIAVVPDGEEYADWGIEPVQTATIFGSEGKRLGTAEAGMDAPDGFDLSTIIVPQASLSVGLPLGSEIMLRFLPSINIDDDLGNLSFWGIGLKHSICQYLPDIIPIHLAVQGEYQSMKIGDIIDINTLAFNAQISKNLAMLTFYGGLGWEQTNFEARYTYNQQSELIITDPETGEEIGREPVTVERPIFLDMKADNDIRATIGMKISFPFVNLFADYSIANTSSFNVGFGIGF